MQNHIITAYDYKQIDIMVPKWSMRKEYKDATEQSRKYIFIFNLAYNSPGRQTSGLHWCGKGER